MQNRIVFTVTLAFALFIGGLVPFSAVSANNNAQFITHFPPQSTVCTNTGIPISVTMKNTGSVPWALGQGYALGSQNPRDNNTWEGWIGISRQVEPGEEFEFVKSIKTPSVPGTYNFQWQMVQDNVEWFGPTTPNITVQVQNCAPPSIPPLCERIDFSHSSPQIRGTQITIRPYASGGSGISKIELYHNPSTAEGDITGTTWILLGSTSKSGGRITWNTNSFPAKTYRIGMKAYDSANRTDDFNENGRCQTSYQISDASPTLTLLKPNGGEIIRANSSYQISWSSSRLDHFALYYSLDSARTWTQIAHPVYGNSYRWTTPVIQSQFDPDTELTQNQIDTVRVKVVGRNEWHQDILHDESDFDFILQNIQTSPTVTISHTPQYPDESTQVRVSAQAFDADGIKTMRIYIDGNETRTCYYGVTFCSTLANTYPTGTHSYHAVAEDKNGIVGSSPTQTFTVSDTYQDQPSFSAPSVSVSHSPSSPDSQDRVRVRATASDIDGIRVIRVYVDGFLRNACKNTTSCSAPSLQYGTGRHTYYAQAEDYRGHAGNSRTRSFTVDESISQSQSSSSIVYPASPSSPSRSSSSVISYPASPSSPSGPSSVVSYPASPSSPSRSSSSIIYYPASSSSPSSSYATTPSAAKTMTVQFSASPSSGKAPLLGVGFSAKVAGTVTGTIIYHIDCTGDGSWEQTITSQDPTHTAVALCNYMNPGTYNAKVWVQRNTMSIQGTTAIFVR